MAMPATEKLWLDLSRERERNRPHYLSEWQTLATCEHLNFTAAKSLRYWQQAWFSTAGAGCPSPPEECRCHCDWTFHRPSTLV
jgi:hypothetical protein